MAKLRALLIIVTVVFQVMFSVGTLYAADTLDGDNEPPFQRNWMHGCPTGSFMAGANIQTNVFLCSTLYGNSSRSTEFVDGDNEPPTQRYGMHACPVGYAMTGLHVDYNYLSCAKVISPTPSVGVVPLYFVDGDNEAPTQRYRMHACPVNSIMVGIRVDRNLLLCLTYTNF